MIQKLAVAVFLFALAPGAAEAEAPAEDASSSYHDVSPLLVIPPALGVRAGNRFQLSLSLPWSFQFGPPSEGEEGIATHRFRPWRGLLEPGITFLNGSSRVLIRPGLRRMIQVPRKPIAVGIGMGLTVEPRKDVYVSPELFVAYHRDGGPPQLGLSVRYEYSVSAPPELAVALSWSFF